jgi:hypothetical protein
MKFKYDPKKCVDEKDIPEGEDVLSFVSRTGLGVKLEPITTNFDMDTFNQLMDPTLSKAGRANLFSTLLEKL